LLPSLGAVSKIFFEKSLSGSTLTPTGNQSIGVKVDLRNGTITGVEALARWVHADKGVIPPNDFIPILEQTGLIKPFTLQVVEKSVSFCKKLRSKGFSLSVAVNLSMHNLRDDTLAAQVGDILDSHELEAQALILEITESAIMHDPELSLAILGELDGMGVRLSIDDFGTGYSSLSYLKRLPVQELKIDRSFVSTMIEDKDDNTIVRSTIELAHNLGLRTVAEGVETLEILHSLQAMTCDTAQGFFISRPLAPDDVLEFLRSSRWMASSYSPETGEYGDELDAVNPY